MLHVMLRHVLSFNCGAFTVLTYTVLLPALIHLCNGQVSSPSGTLVALVGDTATLPCHLHPTDTSSLTVEWSRLHLDPRFVLVWRDDAELQSKKHPSYVNRTSVSREKLKVGDASLNLSSVRVSDEGTYRCFIPRLTDTLVKLVVGAASSPVITTVDDEQSGGLVLQCNSSGWYPQPELLWLDGERKLLSAGHPHTQTLRGPDGFYTLSSTVTVDKKQQNVTCRIQQNSTAQTRDTHVYVPGHSGSSAPLLVGVIALILLVIAVAFTIQTCKQKNKKKNQEDVELQNREDKNGCVSSENKPLMKADEVENETTTTQDEERQPGQEEQETVQMQENHVLVQTHRHSVNEEAGVQAGTQQHEHTSDGHVENRETESEVNVGGDEPTPVSHSKDPEKKQDEEDPAVQHGNEEARVQFQQEEENHEEQREQKEEKVDQKMKKKAEKIEKEKKKHEEYISRWTKNIENAEKMINDHKKELEEVERRLQEKDVNNKTEKEIEHNMTELQNKKKELQEKIHGLEKGLESNKRKKTDVETKILKLETKLKQDD